MEPVIAKEIEVIKVSELIPYARNSRTHSQEQVQQIAASIKEFGFTNPVLVSETNDIIAGHGRLLAANLIGLVEIPCMRLSHLNEYQRKAYVIADNKLALNAGWDDELLRLEIGELDSAGYDLSLTGFSDEELAQLTVEQLEEGLTDEDFVPTEPETPVSVSGDIWQLGSHRLMCGDSTNIQHVDELLGASNADLIFTDPPYGMEYGGGRAAGSRPKGARVKAHGMIKGDDLTGGELTQMISDSIGNAITSAKTGAAVYVCLTWRTYKEFLEAMVTIGVNPKACIVWDKKSIGLGRSNYRPQHEFIFYTGDQWYGDKAQSDIWSMSRGATGEYAHPTQKPVELIEKALLNSSKSGDVVHDCFGGSGSTVIACEKTNRSAAIMELDPKYCDVIIQRWQEFTGRKALHISQDVTYEDLEAERLSDSE